MTVLEIVKYPDEILETKTAQVTKFDRRLHKLLDDMMETMIAADGVGIAAPQVGQSIRAAIVDIGEGDAPIELINPVITAVGGEDVDLEGCLSFPDLYGEVKRPFFVRVEAQERDGSLYELEAEGYEARAIMHEIDHLDGILFNTKISRIVDASEFEELDETLVELGEDGNDIE
ncbi:peptide deformylase [Sporosarcina sp. NCCP-2716]|uniref:peptide deformylase n=1 Tax=Sporosarcina sp. NCCP-2716 TaxID=2943679 RepID=UPI002040A966|nr:peptide deformylase [Sporosarcina sp. NCCP-2716]GKV67748.1 peptide deformylase [Sporosarcina sp. NCCP-2716]